MKNLSLSLFFISIIISWLSCASSYKPINPANLSYNNLSSAGDVAFSYRYDVLNEKGNKKYAKKEAKKGIKVVAVSVTNNSTRTLRFGTDIRLYNGEKEIIPVASQTAASELKQGAAIYLLYGFLTFVKFYKTETVHGVTETETTPIGLAIGPPIAIGNMAVAGGANKKFKNELVLNDIWGKDIAAGQTLIGLVSVAEVGFNPMTIQLVNSN